MADVRLDPSDRVPLNNGRSDKIRSATPTSVLASTRPAPHPIGDCYPLSTMADTHGVAELASTIQSASINRDPDPQRDINPSTAASKLEPVVVESSPAASDVGEDEIPISILRPPPRKRSLPPLPDLRFEQSYLKSIEHANGWAGVAYITVRDQVRLPTCVSRAQMLT